MSTFSPELISKTSNVDSNLILRHKKLDLMATFLELKPIKLKLRQDQTEEEIGFSISTFHCYKDD